MDFDHRKKHKAVCYNVVGKSSNLSKTVTSNEGSNPDSLSNVIDV